ncbi:hypothetical protein BDZ94DRAFT_1318913 [Collybia nuda]|uniref:F-box domain-containing protein n=1 Tax=Collybia nuda TaxID=64659 RepID=A0A9P6CI99_9AGAR|nr:hypothetical protein BDZ94DRAFT_1318913 [Collybia nuda]
MKPNGRAKSCPISRLPYEILAKIFHLNVDSHHSSVTLTPLFQKPPLQLVCVSRYWREVTLECPQLWKAIDLDCGSDNPAVGPGIVEWFLRAGNCPLSLSVSLLSGGFAKCQLGLVPWSRLTSIDIRGDTEFGSPTVLLILPCAPNLVSARLEITDDLWFAFRCRRSKGVLPKCALLNLKHLVVKFTSSAVVEFGASKPLTISCLLQGLVLPALEELKLEASHSAFDEELPQKLLELQVRSEFPLKYLHLARIYWPEGEEMEQFLRQIPTLKSLCLKSCSTMGHLYALLLHTIRYRIDTADNILPSLENVEVYDRSIDHDDNLVLECLESRFWPENYYPYQQPGLTRLKEATMRWSERHRGSLTIVVKKRAEDLRAAGMTLTYPTLLAQDEANSWAMYDE